MFGILANAIFFNCELSFTQQLPLNYQPIYKANKRQEQDLNLQFLSETAFEAVALPDYAILANAPVGTFIAKICCFEPESRPFSNHERAASLTGLDYRSNRIYIFFLFYILFHFTLFSFISFSFCL